MLVKIADCLLLNPKAIESVYLNGELVIEITMLKGNVFTVYDQTFGEVAAKLNGEADNAEA